MSVVFRRLRLLHQNHYHMAGSAIFHSRRAALSAAAHPQLKDLPPPQSGNERPEMAGSSSTISAPGEHFTRTAVESDSRSVPLAGEPIRQPAALGQEKFYSVKISDLVDRIAALTLIEVNDLNELLKKRLNLPDMPAMMMGGAMPMMGGAGAQPAEEEAAPVVKKTSFSVKLIKFDDSKKIDLIKQVKLLGPGLNLVQAKKFDESAPHVIKTDIGEDEAKKLKDSLAAVGGECEIE